MQKHELHPIAHFRYNCYYYIILLQLIFCGEKVLLLNYLISRRLNLCLSINAVLRQYQCEMYNRRMLDLPLLQELYFFNWDPTLLEKIYCFRHIFPFLVYKKYIVNKESSYFLDNHLFFKLI